MDSRASEFINLETGCEKSCFAEFQKHEFCID
jgi:hypothetical protein